MSEEDYDNGFGDGYRDAHLEMMGEKQANEKDLKDLQEEMKKLKKELKIFQLDSISVEDFIKLRTHLSKN